MKQKSGPDKAPAETSVESRGFLDTGPRRFTQAIFEQNHYYKSVRERSSHTFEAVSASKLLLTVRKKKTSSPSSKLAFSCFANGSFFARKEIATSISEPT
jgi:hypothetical protein